MARVDRIKRKYPTPVKGIAGNYRKGFYCIGGAYCQFYGFKTQFPDIRKLANIIFQTRDIGKNYDKAKKFARIIIEENDTGKFRDAWDALEEVMRYPLENKFKH